MNINWGNKFVRPKFAELKAGFKQVEDTTSAEECSAKFWSGKDRNAKPMLKNNEKSMELAEIGGILRRALI